MTVHSGFTLDRKEVQRDCGPAEGNVGATSVEMSLQASLPRQLLSPQADSAGRGRGRKGDVGLYISHV